MRKIQGRHVNKGESKRKKGGKEDLVHHVEKLLKGLLIALKAEHSVGLVDHHKSRVVQIEMLYETFQA